MSDYRDELADWLMRDNRTDEQVLQELEHLEEYPRISASAFELAERLWFLGEPSI